MPETTHEKALDLAERLCKFVALTNISMADGEILKITISIGVASSPNHACEQEQLIITADKVMYAAK